MKLIKMGEAKTIISNPRSIHNYFAWPTVARLQNGKIAVVASGFRLKHVCPFGKTIISYSEDEGETYTAPAPIIDTPLDDRDSGILPYGEKSVLVTSFNNTVEFQRESIERGDFGKEHSDYICSYLNTVKPEDEEKYYGSTYTVSHDYGVSFGEVRKLPITAPHGPIELSDGTIFYIGRRGEVERAKYGDAVVACRINPETAEAIELGKIDDIYYDGEKLVACEPNAIELSDGRILCHIRAQGKRTPTRARTFTIFQSVSADGGVTWSAPEIILGREGGAPPFLMRHSSGALISVYARRKAPFGIFAMISTDEGKSWSVDHEICITDGECDDLGYPSCVELKDGSILTVFYSRKDKSSPAIISQQKWKLEL